MAEHQEESHEGEVAKGGKKKLIVIALLVLLLLAGGGAGLFFSGVLNSFLGKSKVTAEHATAKDQSKSAEKGATGKAGEVATPESAVVYFNLPDVMANLNPGSPTPSFIKTSISLEAPSKEVADKLQAMQPKIQDIVITYVRELRPSDLKGSAGVYRLRDELMLRINKALAPDKITNVLFKELLIQ